MPTRITKKEFFDFIKEQPDERSLDFQEFTPRGICGCPMVHFGLDRGWQFSHCSSYSWVSATFNRVAEFDVGFHGLEEFRCDVANYGDLKKFLGLV